MNSPQETRLGAELRQLVSGPPFALDIEAIGQRARQRHRRGRVLRGASAAAAAVVAAGGVLVAVHGTNSSPAGRTALPRATAKPLKSPESPLLSLAAYLKSGSGPQPGDASLIVSTQTFGGRQTEVTYNLYTDSGDYYAGVSRQLLVTAFDQKANLDDGSDARKVAAARYAAAGRLSSARVKMVNAETNVLGLGLSPAERQKIWDKVRDEKGAQATLPAHPPTGQALQAATDNAVWSNSVDALSEGGGDPQVREGVLRLLSTISGVTVAHSVTGGKATLTLTAAPEAFGGAGQQVLVIDATTGLPVSSRVDSPTASTTTYQVSRVTLSSF